MFCKTIEKIFEKRFGLHELAKERYFFEISDRIIHNMFDLYGDRKLIREKRNAFLNRMETGLNYGKVKKIILLAGQVIYDFRLLTLNTAILLKWFGLQIFKSYVAYRNSIMRSVYDILHSIYEFEFKPSKAR